jgi:thiol:disulfide interchange protein DsbD
VLAARGDSSASANAQSPGPAFAPVRSSAELDSAVKAAGRPAMLDFYADWCVSCKEMEKFTFSKPEVRAALADFVLLQADVTANDDTDKDLMKRYRIVAPPDTLFFGADGAEKRELQLTGEENTAKFLKRVAAVRG